MSADARRKRLRALLAEDAERQHERLVDVCLVWELPDGDTLYVGGGRFDREEGIYTDIEPESGRVVRLEPAQVEAARWFVWWLQERREGRPRDFVTLQVMGERGAGKTHFAVNAMLMLTAESPRLNIPSSIGWMVSKSYEERDELDRELVAVAPSQWYRYVEERRRYTFSIGGTLTNVSADDPENLKRGRVDWLLLNEIQKLGKRPYLNGLARLKDKAGCAVLTGNWPTDKRGEWIYDLDEKRSAAIKSVGHYPVRLVKMASSGNRTLDIATGDQVAQIIRDLDPRLAATDLDGLLMPVTDRAYWEWDKNRNFKARPDSQENNSVCGSTARDITADITSRRTMRPGGYQYIISCDYQQTPHMAAVVHKAFGEPEEPVLWAVDEIIVEGTEEDLIEELLANGYTPENSLIVGDGSGRWQDGAHRPGRTSFQVFRDHRFNIVGPVKAKDESHRPRNPKFDDRCRLHNWALKNSFYMVDPKGAPTLAEGLQKCELKAGAFGQGRPGGPFRHITDAGGYGIWWLHPEKAKRPATGRRLYESIVPIMAERYRLT